MSFGSILTSVIGGIAGFFLGGPLGAVYGAGLGFAIGSFVDPIDPDIPAPGNPDPEEVIMSSTVGDPLPDVLGTSQVTGHLLAYGKERVKTITQRVSSGGGGKGGGGSSQTVETGKEYYMTWAVGICRGPVTYLRAVFKGEEAVWDGDLALPDSGGQETITLDGMGSCTFYFGTDDQVANTTMGEILGDATLNSPYRNFCWALLDDCMVGQTSSRAPTMKFVVSKTPILAFSNKGVIQKYDYNPIHAIHYILNTLCGLPLTWLNSSTFSNAATTISLEYRGISMLFSREQSAITYLTTLNTHIDNILNYTNEGKFETKLIRDDYDEDTIPTIDESSIVDQPKFDRDSWISTANEVKVQYSEMTEVERSRLYAGTLYWAGTNGYYRMISNNNEYDKASRFEKVPNIEDWPIIDCFTRTNEIAVKLLDGTVYARGANEWGQLGINNTTLRPDWTEIYGDVEFEKIIFGQSKAMALTAERRLYLCGDNNNDDILNIGTTSKSLIFRPELEIDDLHIPLVWEMATVYNHFMGFVPTESWPEDPDGTAVQSGFCGKGTNNYGNLGIGIPPYYLKTWVSVGIGDSGLQDIQLGNQSTLVAIGDSPTNFELWGCGINSEGRLGLGYFGDGVISTNRVTDFRLTLGGPWKAYSHSTSGVTVAIKTDGTLWACGEGSYGQLGQGSTTDHHTMQQIGTESNWVKVVTGPLYTAALNNAGHMFTCGYSTNGALGRDTPDQNYRLLLQEGTYETWWDIYACSSGILALK